MSHRPLVGITGAVEDVSYGSWAGVEAVLLPWSYVAAVQHAGGRAVVLPPDPEDRGDPGPLTRTLDALIISGGADMDPALYGAAPHPRTGRTNRARDEFELALARAAVELDVPTLAVCRGMQVLNVAYGGTLAQHLPDVVGHEGHNPAPGAFTEHEIRVRPRSLAEEAVGAAVATVQSHHHQGIERVGDGLVVSAWHPDDHTPEALEDPDARYCLGVLWHPEEEGPSTIVAHLVEAAKR